MVKIIYEITIVTMVYIIYAIYMVYMVYTVEMLVTVWQGRMAKISEHVALLVVTSLIRVSRSCQYRGNCQCQTKLLSADRQPFQHTADLATRAGHWQV